MEFAGVIESLTRTRVTGWVAIVGQETLVPQITLRFTDGRTITPTDYPTRQNAIGFAFDLDERERNLDWPQFIDSFDGVYVLHPNQPTLRAWKVPLYKTVLHGANPGNPTMLLAERLKNYSVSPKPGGKIAVYTIAYNEFLMIPLWARYYCEIVGPENVFVIDHGSDSSYNDMVPKGVNIVRLPRESFDNWLIARIVATYQRFLLESYDTVVYTDSDEFICADPFVLGVTPLSQFLSEFEGPIGITRGFNLCHDLDSEAPYDQTRPVLDQRRFLHRDPNMDKPLITRIPVNWVPGFHRAQEGGRVVPGLYLLHLRWFDLDYALNKGRNYRTSKWDPFDVERKIGSYQRDSEDDIVATFRRLAQPFSAVRSANFDPLAQTTTLPSWMRDAIRI